jgi:hypothetical protein
MSIAAQPTRENRTITVDFRSEATYFQLLSDGKAFLECVIAFVMSLGFQLKHKATCRGSGCLTRHSHDARVRLGGIAIWRIQCTTCKAVCTVLPHFILRYRQMHPEVARYALLATHGGLFGTLRGHQACLTHGALSSDLCTGTTQLSGRAHPVWTASGGRVIWHLGYTEGASAAAFTQSYQEFQRAALQYEPAYWVRGILTDGFDSTTKSMRMLFPGARLGNCLRYALIKLPKQRAAIASPVRKTLHTQFHTLLYRARQRKGLRVFALGQRLRRFADYVTITAGAANGKRVRQWFQDKKAGWYVVLADPQMPVTSTLLDQAHNTIERKLFAMKGFHHPGGSQ